MSQNILIVSLLLFAFVYPVSAQTDVTDSIKNTTGKIIQEQFEAETGLDKVRETYELDAGKLADKSVEYIRGDVPSPVLGNLISQLRAENKFKLWTIKTQNGSAPYYANACQRAANQRMQEGLFNASVKAHFSPWVDISWEAIKSIASGGKSIADLIAENTKEKAETLVKETLFGKAEPKVEVVTIPSYDSCNTVTKISFDQANKRLIAVASGDCGGKKYRSGTTGSVNLRDFTVTVVAPVKVKKVRIKETNRFIFWRPYNIEAQYALGKLNVATVANCGLEKKVDPPPPPPKKKGIIGSLWGWITDWFSAGDDSTGEDDEDITDTSAGTDDTKTIDSPPRDEEDQDQDDDTQTTGDTETDDTDTSKDNTDDTTTDTTENESTEENTDTATFQCGDIVEVDGQGSVATFPYSIGGELNSYCNNSCAADETCKVLPESVGAYRDSCVYCAKDVEDEPEDQVEPQQTCSIPRKQIFNNGLMRGFGYTVIDETTVRVENVSPFCGMESLEEFKKAVKGTIPFVKGDCTNVWADTYQYTDIRGDCSFLLHYGS